MLCRWRFVFLLKFFFSHFISDSDFECQNIVKEIKDKKLMKKGYKNGHKAKCLLSLQEQKILSMFSFYMFIFLYNSEPVQLVNTHKCSLPYIVFLILCLWIRFCIFWNWLFKTIFKMEVCQRCKFCSSPK